MDMERDVNVTTFQPALTGRSAESAALRKRFQVMDPTSQLVVNGHWLIKDLLPANAVTMIVGKSGSKKSFVAIDMAMHLALGQPWRGMKTKQCDVFILSSEAGTMGSNRVHGWLKHHGRQWPWSVLMSPISVDLRTSTIDSAALVDLVKCTLPNIGLVIVDTLTKNLGGGSDNAPEDMNAFLGNCEKIQRALDCTVLIIHHHGKDGARGARGHSSLVCAVSTELTVESEKGSSVGKITVTKQRDAEDGREIGFEVQVVELAVDEDGGAVNTLVVLPGEVEPAQPKPQGMVQRAVVEAIEVYALEAGMPNPPGIGWPEPGRVRVVDTDAFIVFAVERIQPADGRKTIRRAIDALVERRVLGRNGGKIWKG